MEKRSDTRAWWCGALGLAFIFVVLTGCQGGATEGQQAAYGPQRIQEAGKMDQGATDVDFAPAPPGAVRIRLMNGRIEMPATLKAGQTTLNVINVGTMQHSIAIKGGKGGEIRLGEDLAPNTAANVTVNLEPGKYIVYCPVADHGPQGMTHTLEVQ